MPKGMKWECGRRVEQRILLIHVTPGEYIIRARRFAGRGCRNGCRILVVFKDAGFEFSADRGFPACATRCGDIADAAISTL